MGYDVKGQLHIFVMVHWCVEIKVLYVCTHKYGVRCLYGAVDGGFICCDILYGSFDFTRVVNYISSDSKSCSVCFIFLWFDVTDYSYIFHFPILWDLWFWNEEFFYDPAIMLPTPCASLTNSLEKYLCHTIFSSPLNKCLYYFLNPVSGFMKAFICIITG